MKRFKYGLTGLLMVLGLAAVMPAVAGEVVAYAAGGWFAVDSRTVKDTTLEGGAIIGGETNLVLRCSPSAWGAVSGGSGVTVAYSNATSGAVGTIAAQTAEPTLDWTPPAEKGTYELSHQPVDASGNPLGTAQIAKFEVEVPAVPILAQPEAVDNTTLAVYTNGVLSAETVPNSGEWYAWSNETAVVVYTAKDGSFFEGGATVVTNALDTSKNPATADAPDAPTKPTVAVEYTAPVYVDGVASNGIAYWTTNTVITYTVVTSATSYVTWGESDATSYVTWGESGATNWFVVKDANVQIDGGVTCRGHVNLILCEGAKLVVTNVAMGKAGIATDASGSFTVYGQPDGAGELEAWGGSCGAGIGGDDGADGRNITINGGVVRATGDSILTTSTGAGIGGGGHGNGMDITINGGTVTATGSRWRAPGIGGGCDGNGMDITINGGTVTAICGAGASSIGGGGSDCYGRNITINGGKVFAVCPLDALPDAGVVSSGNVIGGGGGTFSSNVFISPSAEVLFNLTGAYIRDYEVWSEPLAELPDDFSGFVIMTPGTQAVDRVLVGGLSTLSTFVLTNTVTGATGEIVANGAETTFAHTYCSLTNVDGQLTFTVRPPSLWIDQQPNATNGYAVVADTDGNDGIANYRWMLAEESEIGAQALVKGYAIDSRCGKVEGESIPSIANESYSNVVDIAWLPAGNAMEAPGLPFPGELRFTCSADLELHVPEELAGDVSQEQFGTLTRDGNDWVWRGKLFNYGFDILFLMLRSDAPFVISDVRWVSTDYSSVVGEGPDQKSFPTEQGIDGASYVCQMTYGHEGIFYTGDSEVFTYVAPAVPILAQPEAVDNTTIAVYTNGVLSAETSEESGEWYAWSNETAVVVYTAKDGYFFEGGATVVTNALDTSKNPATADAPAAPTKPTAGIEYVAPVYVDGVASNGIAYWTTNTVSTYTVVTSATSEVTWGESGATNWFVVSGGDFQIDGGVTCAGHVNLILCEGAKLVVTNTAGKEAGIKTDMIGSFTVYGQPDGAGELIAWSGGSYRAGIGGRRWYNVGRNITINGGRVTAIADGGGAGIGGGLGNDGFNIVINGGYVTAVGNEGGAGIGGGSYGSGSGIVINGGDVTAVGSAGSAAIGGGFGGRGENIAINGGTIRVAALPMDISGNLANARCGDFIGNGAATGDVAPASNVTISAAAKVLFNLTGAMNDDAEWIEPLAPMPKDFVNGTIMTPGTQEVDRVLVGGCGGLIEAALPSFTLTNTVTGAILEAALWETNTFACKFCCVESADGKLVLKAMSPVLTITQQPEAANGYEILAETTGDDGILKYSWYKSGEETEDFHSLTNKMIQQYAMGTFEGTNVTSDLQQKLVCMAWDELPVGGAFHFTCTNDLGDAMIEEMEVPSCTLTRNGDDWVLEPILTLGMYMICVYNNDNPSAPFTLENVRYVVRSTELVDEGATMNVFPADKGEVGGSYYCRVTHGHAGIPYTGDSEDFIYRGIRVGDDAWATLSNGVCEVTGTGDVWNSQEWPGGSNPLARYKKSIMDFAVASGVTSVGEAMLYKFYAVTNATLAASVTNVAGHAFYNCHSLQGITFQGATPALGEQAIKFTAAIRMNGETPEVYTIPNVTSPNRKVWAKDKLTDKDWTDVTGKTDAERGEYHFFKVVVE